MRLKEICAIMLIPFATGGIGMRSVRAQTPTPPGPSSGAIPLEAAAVPAGGGGPVAYPSPQAPGYRRHGGNAALSRLGNPFDGSAPSVYPAAVSASPQVHPSAQSGNGHRHDRVAVRQLRNPYDSGYGQPAPGLFDAPSPQYLASPQAPGAGMPGGPYPGGPYPGAAAGVPVMVPPGTAAVAGATAGGAMPGALTGAEAAAAPGAPTPPSTTTPEGAPGGAGAAGGAGDTFGAAATSTGPGFGGALEAAATPFAMIGDLSPTLPGVRVNQRTPPIPTPNPPPGPPRPPGARGASPIFSSIRTYKISENQSPRPQDRVFFFFNYYDNLNETINRVDSSPVTQMKAYIYTFGFEKTFNEGMGSIGMRLPLDNLTANSFGNVISTPTSTALGNLTIFAKYILAQNARTGSLITACFAISPETATSRFAGAPYVFPLNSTYFQPCLAYIYNYNRWYFQGFTGFNFPANNNDVSLIYNDIGFGYFLIRNPDRNAFLTALAPSFEVHVNNPINHRDWYNRFSLSGSPDVVDLTFGVNFGIRNQAVLSAAYVTPVTATRPFDGEAVLMLNIFYGRTRANIIQQTPPPTF